MDDNKRVLVIAYAFPPCGGAGVQRTAKFVRYLPDFGWRPTVVTVLPSCYGVVDNSHTEEIANETEVIRTGHFDPVARFAKPSATTSQTNGNGSKPTGPSIKSLLRQVAKRSWITLDKNLLIPDQAVTWCPRAVAAAMGAHKKNRFDLIYATGEPYSDYFTAFTVSRMTGVPFIVDMRDPWTRAPYRIDNHSRSRQSIERWQERRILGACGACVFANRSMDLYAEDFPQWARKFHYIPNGYDQADFDGVEPRQFDKFTIVHSGTFLPGYRTADSFLLALREFLNADATLKERLQVVFVGKIGEEQKLIRQLSLDSVVNQTGYIPHRESIAYLKGADVLLLVGGKHKWEETGKVYEYLAAEKPVLALVQPDGAAAELLSRFQTTKIVDRESVSSTVTALKELLSRPGLTGTQTHNGQAKEYERKRLTGQLAEVFDNCVKRDRN